MFKQNPNYRTNLRQRQQKAGALQYVFSFALLLALLALLALLLNVVNHVFGYVASDYKIQPSALSTQPLESLSSTELVSILRQHISTGVQRRLDSEKPLEQRPQTELLELLTQRVLQPKVVASYTLSESLFQVNHIKTEVAQKYPTALLTFRSWLNWDFLRNSMSNDPLQAGIRTAIAGSLWVIMLTILMAFPAGVGAAVWLQEYNTSNTWIKRVVQTNIDNLAGVPSIIYGILGLAVFVRTAGAITSGNLFGSSSPNGRTILSAALTMAMLILPVIIINAQEALRAVPSTLRQASFGLGATRWQTIWYHVLPAALPGIMTGTILAISRAIGETAPLIVVGAATLITSDPTSPFSQFTVLPIQIYNWTSRPQVEFHFTASAAIMVLLIILLSLNGVAIWLRNRFSTQRL